MAIEASESAAQRSVEVVENVPIARETFRIRLRDPAMAAVIRPGQFLMIRPTYPGTTDPFFGRPFALYDTADGRSGAPEFLDIVYLVIGRGTASLSERTPGDRLAVWGPLGNGFGPPPEDNGDVVFVAGGIGQTPFLALGRWWMGARAYGGVSWPKGVTCRLDYGVRTAALLAGVEDFERAGIPVNVATDDGSAGHAGLVTDLLEARLKAGESPSKLVGCGPPPLLKALGALAEREGIACEVSIENQMACGFGACFSCVMPIRQADGSVDLRRVCLEGPVFPSQAVAWDEMPS